MSAVPLTWDQSVIWHQPELPIPHDQDRYCHWSGIGWDSDAGPGAAARVRTLEAMTTSSWEVAKNSIPGSWMSGSPDVVESCTFWREAPFKLGSVGTIHMVLTSKWPACGPQFKCRLLALTKPDRQRKVH